MESVDSSDSKSWIVTSFENTWTHQRRKRRQQAREQPKNIEQTHEIQQKDNCETYADEADYEVPMKRLKKEDCLSGSAIENGPLTEACSLLKTDASLKGVATNQNSRDSVSHANNCSSLEGSNISYARNDSSAKFVPQIIEGKAVSVDTNEAVERREVKQEPYDEDRTLLKCLLTVHSGADCGIAIHFDWISGQSRECMHQLMLYLRNKFQ